MTKEIVKIACKYYQEGNSLNETSDYLKKDYQFRMHPNTVKYHLRKEGVILRTSREGITTKKRKHIDVDKILKLYPKVKSLRHIERETRISKAAVKKILIENEIEVLSNDQATQLFNLKYEKFPYNGNIHDKAYLYGFVLGDVHVHKKSKFTLRAVTHTTHKLFVDLFKSEFDGFGNLMCKFIDKKKEWRLCADLDYKTFNFLEHRKMRYLPSWINSNNFLSFFSGFIDSDGSIIVSKCRNQLKFTVRVFGQEIDTLNQIKYFLENKGYHVCLYRNFKAGESRIWNEKVIRYNKDYYALEIYRKDEVIAILNSLSLRHKEKIARKDLILHIYKENLTKFDEVKVLRQNLRDNIKNNSI